VAAAPSASFHSGFPAQEAPSHSAQETDAQTDEVDSFYFKLLDEGKYFFQSGQYDEAIRNFEIAFFGFIDNPGILLECYVHLTVAHANLKNAEKAKDYFDKINRLRLWDDPAAARLPQDLLNEYKAATAHFLPPEERAASQKMETERIRKEEAARLLAEARAAESPDKKADLYLEALDKDSSNIDVYFELSRALRDGKRYKQAARAMSVLTKAGLSDPRIPIELGTIHLLNKDYDRAIASLKKGRSASGDSIELSYLLGRAYFLKKMYDEATAELARVVEQSPDYEDAASLLEECRKKEKD